MAKFGFISDLEEDTKSPKAKFQLFEAEIGFERAEVLIPFESADEFSKEAYMKKPKTKQALLRIASKFGGSVQ